jgi:predicted Zn-dependent protease
VNVSYSGAQREADWWSLRRRYDKDNKELFTDEYAAWVLYTIPKTEMNRQVSLALETSVTRDSALYDVTLALARDILLQGYDEKHVLNAAALRKAAADSYDPPGSVTARAIDEGISPADEYLLGRDVAASVLSNYRVWDNPAMTEYVNMICSAIVINSPRPSTFNGYYAAILDSDEINAFASPAGHVFVTRGLVSSAKSEDALAAVIAHEIAHILLNHGIRAIQSNRDMEDWMNIFNSSGSRLVRDRINAGFSRMQEFDADITAMSLMAAAGYYPSALLDMLRELEKLQGGRSGGFNTTHPSPTSRLVNATVAASRYLNIRDTSGYRRGRFAAVSGL